MGPGTLRSPGKAVAGTQFQRKLPASKTDRVEVLFGYLIGAADEVFDVVVSGVKITADEPVGAAGGEYGDQVSGSLRRRPRRVRWKRRCRQVGADQSGADEENADSVRGRFEREVF